MSTSTPAPYLTPMGARVTVTLEDGTQLSMTVSRREEPGTYATAMREPTFHAHTRPGGYGVYWGGRTTPGIATVELAS